MSAEFVIPIIVHRDFLAIEDHVQSIYDITRDRSYTSEGIVGVLLVLVHTVYLPISTLTMTYLFFTSHKMKIVGAVTRKINPSLNSSWNIDVAGHVAGSVNEKKASSTEVI